MLSTTHAFAASALPPPIDDAIAQGRAAGKPVVLDFYTDWCHPCRRFDEQFMPDAGVQAALSDVLFVRYDAEKGEGVAAAGRYQVNAFPTFIVLDADGKVVTRDRGLPDAPASFVRFIERGLSLRLDEATVKARLADKKASASQLLGAARWLAAHRRLDESLAAYARVAAADPHGKQGIAPEAEWEARSLARLVAYRKQLAEDAARFAERWPGSERAGQATYLAAFSGRLPRARVHKLLAASLERAWDHVADLNHFAYLALALGDDEIALQAAQRAVALAPKDAGVRDTLAEVHHYRGERVQALAVADEAIALEQDPGELASLKENRARFAGPSTTPSSGVSDERAKAERELAAMMQEDAREPEEEAASGPGNEEVQKYRAFMVTSRNLFKEVGASCASQAGALSEAYVRIELPAAGGKPTKVTVLEPDATAKLKKCAVEAFAQKSFPPPPEMIQGRYTGEVRLKVESPLKLPALPARPDTLPDAGRWPR